MWRLCRRAACLICAPAARRDPYTRCSPGTHLTRALQKHHCWRALGGVGQGTIIHSGVRACCMLDVSRILYYSTLGVARVLRVRLL